MGEDLVVGDLASEVKWLLRDYALQEWHFSVSANDWSMETRTQIYPNTQPHTARFVRLVPPCHVGALKTVLITYHETDNVTYSGAVTVVRQTSSPGFSCTVSALH